MLTIGTQRLLKKLLARNNTTNSLTKIKKSDGTLTDSDDEILFEFESF